MSNGVARRSVSLPDYFGFIAIGIMFVALQQPWSSHLRGADHWAIVTATLVATAGIVLRHKFNYSLVVKLSALAPLAACVIWQFGSNFAFGTGFGAGASLALAGLVLAGELKHNLTPILLSLFVVFTAWTTSIFRIAVSSPWPSTVGTLITALVPAFILWWIVIPLWQFESRQVAQILKKFESLTPTRTTSLTVGRLVALIVMGSAVLISALIAGGGSSNLAWSPNDYGMAVMLLPAVAASSLPPLFHYWPRSAPARRVRDITNIIANLVIGVAGVFATLAISNLVVSENTFNSALGLIVALAIIGIAVLVTKELVPFSAFKQAAGRVSRAMFGTKACQKAQSLALPEIPVRTDNAPFIWPGISISETVQTANPVLKSTTNTTTNIPVAKSTGAAPVQGSSVPLSRPKWTPQIASDANLSPQMLQRIATEAPHLRPVVVRNPSTDVGTLQWLATLDDPDVNLALVELSVG
jgi:hypothetical protein